MASNMDISADSNLDDLSKQLEGLNRTKSSGLWYKEMPEFRSRKKYRRECYGFMDTPKSTSR